MLRRTPKHPVMAEVPASNGTSSRPGALGRPQLQALAGLASALAGTGSVLLSGPAKSQVGVGLAAAATADGRRVALLECDLAAPSLAGTLGLEATPGLHEYLSGEAEAAQILQPMVLAGPAAARATEPLTCIVAGEAEPTPVGLLDSERCDHAIERLRRAYDLLVIEGPPLSEDPDSLRALVEHASTTLVCGRCGEIPKRLPMPIAGVVHFV
jgi:Mrp family chromosome partitioning ATPase